MKPYTKTGDKGSTSLIGGKRVKKDDIHLEIYGTLDELSSFIGLLKQSVDATLKNELHHIQEILVLVNSLFANDNEAWDAQHIFQESETENIEKQIDQLCSEIAPCHEFIIPGCNACNALAHVCRCVCRRAERQIHKLPLFSNQEKAAVYINRLSDYFFVLSRKLEK
jgi:cob(I)alamin adenosyltransferase